jgi:hypothetical protein
LYLKGILNIKGDNPLPIKKKSLVAILMVLAPALVLGAAMNKLGILIYLYGFVICFCAAILSVLFEYKRLSTAIDAWFIRHRVTGAIWLLDAIGGLTVICAVIALVLEPALWQWFAADKTPILSSFLSHLWRSGLIVVGCVALYAFQVYVAKNSPSDKCGNRVLSWVIWYLQNETTLGRAKSEKYLLTLLVFQIKVGRLHLWGRRNNKDVFIRPSDLKKEHYVFELYGDNRYRIRSLRTDSVIWSPTLIEHEVRDIWPQDRPAA